MLFKNRYVDFVVEENLTYALSKEHKDDSPRLYVKVEKTNINTMDLLKQVMKKFSLPRKKIGIAGLKDKHALARQRFCFHTGDVAKIGDAQFIKSLQEITKVIDYGFSKVSLNLSSPITNSFWIRLRKDPKNREKKAVEKSFADPRSIHKGGPTPSAVKGENIKNDFLEERLKKLYTEGFLNLYGEQRFGFTHANHRIAQEIIEGKKKTLDKSEVIFKLQSLSSRLFNNYCTYRFSKYGRDIIEGDIFASSGGDTTKEPGQQKNSGSFDGLDTSLHSVGQIPTGPILGDDMTWADPDTQAGKLEKERKEHFEINNKVLEAYQKYGIFGLRRPIRVKPTKASHSRQGDDLLLQFTLGKGSYASVLIEELLGE